MRMRTRQTTQRECCLHKGILSASVSTYTALGVSRFCTGSCHNSLGASKFLPRTAREINGRALLGATSREVAG